MKRLSRLRNNQQNRLQNMKRISYLLAVLAAAVSVISCQKGGKPEIEFEQILYTIYQQGSVEVSVNVSEPVSSELTVPLLLSGDAVKDVDYTISADYITIKAGESSGSVTVGDISLTESKTLTLRFNTPAGYSLGTKFLAVISPDPQEAMIYSFNMSRGYALENFIVSVNVTGAISGKDLATTEDIMIPLLVSGPGASNLVFSGESKTKSSDTSYPAYILLNAGETSGSARFTVPAGFSGNDEAIITVDPEYGRFIAGDNSSVSVAVRGVQTPDKLVGTWTFSKTFALNQINEDFTEMEEDTELIPTHNEGFTLTFAKEADGSVSLTPGGSGDFMNFFRKCTVTLASPINCTRPSTILGKHTSYECQMYVSADGIPYQYNTYYTLSCVNRSFSADDETLGEAVVVFGLDDNGLRLEFRDYDTPPFGEMLWDDKFDPDFFGFASLFVKK